MGAAERRSPRWTTWPAFMGDNLVSHIRFAYNNLLVELQLSCPSKHIQHIDREPSRRWAVLLRILKAYLGNMSSQMRTLHAHPRVLRAGPRTRALRPARRAVLPVALALDTSVFPCPLFPSRLAVMPYKLTAGHVPGSAWVCALAECGP